jgi:hypothetical protein
MSASVKKKSASQSVFFNRRILVGSVFSSVGAFLVLVALGVYPDTSALAQAAKQNQNSGMSAVFPARAGEHVARRGTDLSGAEMGAVYSQGSDQALSQSPITPGNSSFTASWGSVSGATGYRLDVSTNKFFSSYVSGYEDLDVGNVTSRSVTGLNVNTTYYYRVRAYDGLGMSGNSEVMAATVAIASSGLVINATFDSSITSNANSAAIESMINQAIAIYQSLFSDPIIVSILFRYSDTAPDGTSLSSGALAQSIFVIYSIPWDTYIIDLKADATTTNDAAANASLPSTPLSTNILVSGPNGRAIGLVTAPAMFADGSIGNGGPYDGIVTLNSTQSFQFTRPTGANNYDALRSTEHEIDEVLGLGSFLNSGGSDLRPQDLFSWSAPNNRNITFNGSRYFSIDSGSTNFVNFNQDSDGDFGDWLSGFCPQANPYVQNAFGCTGQFSDVTTTSPEGITLDVIGYDLVGLVSSYDPSTDPSVVEWLKADALSLTDGAPIVIWPASKGNDLIQVTVTARPIFKTNILNGRPIVRTDGTQQWMASDDFLSAVAQPDQIFVVFRTFTTSSSDYILSSSTIDTVQGIAIFPGNTFDFFAGIDQSMGASDTNWHILCVEVNGASSRYSFNGGAFSTMSGSPGTESLSNLEIGGGVGAIGNPSSLSRSDYAEIIIRSGHRDVTPVENYLNTKWAISSTPTPTPTPTPTATPVPTPTPTPTPSVTVSASAASVAEGGNATLIVSCSPVSPQPLTVFYTVGGSAQLGTDYTLSGLPGQVVIPAGQASATITLHALNDVVTERRENVRFKLSAGAGYKLPRRGATSVTITLPGH